MSIVINELQIGTEAAPASAMQVSMATEADFGNFSWFSEVDLFDPTDSDRYAYLNVETCPDCSAGMIRQGRCCACPSCGFESCVV
jgi:hypothetical protein